MKAVIFTHFLYLILMKTFTVKGVPRCESKVELRAVILSCPAKETGCDDEDPLAQSMRTEEFQILHPNSNSFDAVSEEKERGFPEEVKDCKRKIVINLKIKNLGKIPCDDEYIVVDHVFDPVTGGRGRLLSPVVVKLRQEQMVQLYGLNFERVINSDPFEEQKSNGNICSVDPGNPTCGVAMYDGKPIPFSEGFCCSSDPHVNAKRQSSPAAPEDSFLYTDYEPSRGGGGGGGTRVVREQKPRAIVNPELVRLKSGNSDKISEDRRGSGGGGGGGSDCGMIRDIFCWDKVPNYLIENDRKIVCDKGDFMKELCRLRADKLEAEATTTEKYRKVEGGRTAELRDKEGSGGSGRESSVHDLLLLKHLEEKLSPIPLSDVLEPANGGRGKRENKEGKTLSLDEKLELFANSKKQTMNRKKRLLEVSPRRFRKAGEGYQNDLERYPSADCARTCPPRYFFSHDRAIIDPLETMGAVMNSSYKNLVKDDLQEESLKRRGYQSLKKSEPPRKKRRKDRSFYRRQWKNENKQIKSYLLSNNEKQSQIQNEEGGRGSQLENVKPPRGGRRFNRFRGAGKVKLGRTEETRKYEWGMGRKEKEEGVRGGERKFKNFLHKSESNKKLTKQKTEGAFLSRNREQQKLVRGHKKVDVNQKEVFESRKLKEPSVTGLNKEQNEQESGSLKEKGNLKSVAIPQSRSSSNFRHPEKLENEALSLNKETVGKKNQYNEMTSHLMEPARKNKIQEVHPGQENAEKGIVHFDLEITRNHIPDMSENEWPSLSSFSDMMEKHRGEAKSSDGRVDLFKCDLSGSPHYLKRMQNLVPFGSSSHNYIIGSEKIFPQKYQATGGGAVPDVTPPRFVQGSNERMFEKQGPRMYGGGSQSNYFAMRERPFPPSGVKEPPEPEKRVKREGGESGAEEGCAASNGDKIGDERSFSYTFQSARVIRGSELEPRRAEEDMKGEEGSCPAGGSDFVPRLNHENSSFDWNSDFSHLRELLKGLHYSTVGLRPEGEGEENGKAASERQRLILSYANAPDYVLKELESSLSEKRQTEEEEAKGKPSEGESAQDTAHCMRFGDMWYSMYSLKPPMISQVAGIQLFDKHSTFDGTSRWRDLTKGKMIRIGTFLSKAEDELPSMSITFQGDQPKKVKSAIDTDNYYLLIPSHVSDPSKLNSYPQFEGGPAEYLLVQSKDVTSGGECNMVGTSFEAFARQADRCSQRRGSCLKRQPVDLWREDMEARIRGKRGKYFVENFGNVPNSPVKTYTNLTGQFLALEYYGDYTSTIEIEIKADSNAIVRKGSNAQIPMVYIDNTYPKKTRIIMSVLNIGLTSSYFRPRLGDCPPDLNPAWCPLEGPLVIIPPQQRHDFKLDLSGTLPSGKTVLTVQVLNQINKPIAFRQIILKRGDRCVCAFHCKCNCIGSSASGRSCRRLSLEDYRKAGYMGSFPFRGGAAIFPHESSILGNGHIVFFTACYVLFLLGMMKGILGIYYRRIGISGTRIITGPRELCGYYECELLGCSVLYDENGFPVHPTTCQPVQIVPLWVEILINFLFFFLYPLRALWFLILSLPCCKTFCFDYDNYCQNDGGGCDRKSFSPLISKQANFKSVYYNMTTVNSKKLKEEYQPYPAYNGDDDPLEEDDTEFVLQEMKRYRKK